MNLYQDIKPLQSHLQAKRRQNLRIGFVPTMGALHAGHLSLIDAAKEKCDIVACSIFVNPTQFNNLLDLELYPRNIENDIRLLVQSGCYILFHPTIEEMYGSDFHKDSAAVYGPYINLLEGAHRPGHFDGVITIVKRLFEIIEPDEVFFGQKDYQQCLVIKTLLERNFTNIVFNRCAIKRETDGLAMSSRNVKLNKEERIAASLLIQALNHIKANWNAETWETSIAEAKKMIAHNKHLQLEYLCVTDPDNLTELSAFNMNAIALIAAYCGQTRLIDNLLLN
ncbi:MAG: pantoate--beta-alanine ligase [Bacteroidota bacterium]|nr:pantoate--beta-alanine ligase [Bacteroidota bacterium]